MTDTITSPYRVTSGEGIDDVWWKGGRITVKAGAAETDGAFAQIETDDPRGSGPPWHLHHDQDETFYVLEGEVIVKVGEQRMELGAGDYLFAPRGTPHAYIVRSERARMLVTVNPPGPEELFISLGTPVAGSQPPTDTVMPPMEEMARQFARYNCEILGPPLSLDDLS